jgi:hypothetical protein
MQGWRRGYLLGQIRRALFRGGGEVANNNRREVAVFKEI